MRNNPNLESAILQLAIDDNHADRTLEALRQSKKYAGLLEYDIEEIILDELIDRL